jgi:hypothetical protein
MRSSSAATHDKRAPDAAAADRLNRAAVGLESEFTLIVDHRPVRPEALFRDPRSFMRGPLMHRVGTSYHLPNSAAIYFDTGVIEIATPAMELERGCMARAGRSMWESIALVRSELDRWERARGHRTRLVGFSTHYNVSLAANERRSMTPRRLNHVARALTYILPGPVMLLATNRRSTGVGVRPRPHRIEVTADFTPDPALMIATGSLITGIVRHVTTWPLSMLRAIDRQVPVIAGFAPMRHTSRQGWLARADRYPSNPFVCDIDDIVWPTTTGAVMSLRDIGRATFDRFRRVVARFADPFSLRLIRSILSRGGASLLMLGDRPAAYEDVGRLSVWSESVVRRNLTRSRYERALMCAVSGRPLQLDGAFWTPIRVRGWSRVVFRRVGDGAQIIVPVDALVSRLDEWERNPA